MGSVSSWMRSDAYPRHMDIYEALYTTRAMRRVKPDPIPMDVQAKILDAAIRAPSGGNTQGWRFMLVDDRAILSQLGPIYRECIDTLWETIYKDRKKKDRPLPAFKSDMLLPDVAELFQSNFSIEHDITQITPVHRALAAAYREVGTLLQKASDQELDPAPKTALLRQAKLAERRAAARLHELLEASELAVA